ncbi:MAG: hypothetical protein RMJ35_03470 [Phycisphaerales bacterium]|nr:hypothetical protein [Phycisphaerales bacterium]
MSRRPLVIACVIVSVVVAAGCLQMPSPFAVEQPLPARPSRDGKPTTPDPITETFQKELARQAADAPPGELLRPIAKGISDRPKAEPSGAPAESRGAGSSPSADSEATIEALRRKSEAYARALEMMLAQRATEPPRASAVQWIDPASYQVSLGTQQSSPESPNAPAPAPIAGEKASAGSTVAKAGNTAEAENASSIPPRPQGVSAMSGKTGAASGGQGEASLAGGARAKGSVSGPTGDAPSSGHVASASESLPPRAASDSGGSSDAANLPLALSEVNERPTVAAVTPERTPAPELPLSLQSAGGNDAGLISRLSRRIRENPRDIASHLDYQLLLFVRDEQVPNLAAIAPLPQEDRELVTAVLDGLSNLRSTLRRDANLLIAEKIAPLVELAERLKTGAELTVPTMVLARRVEGFGRYETMDPRLIANRETPAIVYCEIENFSSQLNADQQWETNLSMEVVLFSEMGQQVFQDLPAKITDTSRTRRRDFFVRKLIKFPSNLTIGRYVLKVTMVDLQSNRVAETSLPLQVVAQ